MNQPIRDDLPPVRPRVLVVDDERAIGRALVRLLGSACDVVAETRGEDALLRIERGERYDVIFCDVRMPEMDGMAMHSELLRIAPDQAARVVFLTGDPNDRSLADRSRVAVAKPFDAATLMEIVHARARIRG